MAVVRWRAGFGDDHPPRRPRVHLHLVLSSFYTTMGREIQFSFSHMLSRCRPSLPMSYRVQYIHEATLGRHPGDYPRARRHCREGLASALEARRLEQVWI